jgi:hypothetical protein
MEIEIIDFNGRTIAEFVAEGLAMEDERSALDLLAQAGDLGAQAILLREGHLPAAFFDLSSKLAGDILNKFAVYRFQLAIVGDFEKYQSRSLQAFIRESNRGRVVCFAQSRQQALDWF